MRYFAVLLSLPVFLLAGLLGKAVWTQGDATTGERDWPVYKADAHSTSYSPLDQIDRENVHRLEVAWVHHTGETEGPTIECNPIVIDGVLYATTPLLKAIALDAATGERLWTFDPFGGERARGVNRGLTYWADGDDRRLFLTADGRLYALDAATGRPVPGFGEGGSVDLARGLDREGDLRVTANTPGIVYGNLLILGSVVGEGPGPSAPGHIRAFDVRTGERRWIFHTIPHPGEYGYETWPPDAWKRAGGANAWAGMSLDAERGIVYCPTGSAAYDHHGGDRVGKNLFANSVLALDAATGRRLWHFQIVHHDLWDYDVASPPTLVTVEHDGRRIDAVAQPTKIGHLFLFDRETGEPLFPVEERPVPQTTLPGEQTWPTQPFPVKPPPYARQGFTEADITRRTPAATAYVRERYFDPYGPGVLFAPPSIEGDIVSPQFNGGTDWGGAAVDPARGILFVNASDEPEFLSMAEAPEGAAYPYLATGHVPLKDDEGYPISTPPWGTLSAIDLNEGRILWKVPLGTYPELEAQGHPPTGTFNMGGPILTAGGLVFIGASMDERFRAFDRETGEVLWEAQLPAGGYATPATYMVDGRQYVVIAAGGGGKPGTRPGDAYVAFALP